MNVCKCIMPELVVSPVNPKEKFCNNCKLWWLPDHGSFNSETLSKQIATVIANKRKPK